MDEPTIIPTAEAVAIITPTVEAPAELVAIITESSVGKLTADRLMQSFAPSFAAIQKLIDEAAKVDVTDATMVSEIKRARTLRLGIREVRVAADKLREKLKLDSKREGDAIQGCFNLLKFKAEPIEERLQAAEDFAVRAEAARKAKLKADREALVKPYADPSFYQLGDMPEDAFNKLMHGLKAAAQAIIDAAEKARVEKEAKEKAEADERERVRLENERLRAEAAEKEAALKIEREKAAQAAELARREKEAADAAAAKAKADAEAELAKAREAAAKEAARLKAEADAKLAEERKLAEAAAAKLKAENDARLLEMTRVAEEAAAAERKRVADEQREAAEKARTEALRLQAIAEVERQKTEAARAKAEEAARLERLAREKLEAEAKSREDARLAAIAAEQAALAKAAKAPEKEKLIAFAMAIRALQVPELSTDAGRAVATVVKTYQEKLAVFVEDKAAAL